MPRYVLDSFALLAYLGEEPGAEAVEELLRRAQAKEIELWIHSLQLCEVFYIIWQEAGETEAYQAYGLVRQYPVHVEPRVEEPLLLTAGRLKATYNISLADAFAAAFALVQGATLVTGDPELKQVEEGEGLSVLWLPRNEPPRV